MDICSILADFENSNRALAKTIANIFKLKGIESDVYTAEGAWYVNIDCSVFDMLKVIKLVGFDKPDDNHKVLCKKDMYAVVIGPVFEPKSIRLHVMNGKYPNCFSLKHHDKLWNLNEDIIRDSAHNNLIMYKSYSTVTTPVADYSEVQANVEKLKNVKSLTDGKIPTYLYDDIFIQLKHHCVYSSYLPSFGGPNI